MSKVAWPHTCLFCVRELELLLAIRGQFNSNLCVIMRYYRLALKTSTCCLYITGFSMRVREHIVFRVFHEPCGSSVKPEGLYLPSAAQHEAPDRFRVMYTY